jgi:hypothetical protein
MFDTFGTLGCDNYLARVQGIAVITKKDYPEATIYFMIYEGKTYRAIREKKGETVMYPTVGSVDAKIRSMKRYLEILDQDLSRFRFVNGGFREGPAVEVWIVPNGAPAPRPTPTVTKMKFRKGKPRGFCTSCC